MRKTDEFYDSDLTDEPGRWSRRFCRLRARGRPAAAIVLALSAAIVLLVNSAVPARRNFADASKPAKRDIVVPNSGRLSVYGS